MSEAVIVIVCALVWWASGVASFVFWWTKDYDLELADALFGAVGGGLLGPLSFPVCAWSYYDVQRSLHPHRRIVVMKRRKS